MANVIRLDGDLAQNHASTVTQVADELPKPASVSLVDGNFTEPAAAAFTELLQSSASELANRVEALRQYVAKNAAALSQAVATLQERDELNASEAEQTTSIIDAAQVAPSLPVAPGATSTRPGMPL